MSAATHYIVYPVVVTGPSVPDVHQFYACPKGDRALAIGPLEPPQPPETLDGEDIYYDQAAVAVDAVYWIPSASSLPWVCRAPMGGDTPRVTALTGWGAMRAVYPLGEDDLLVFGQLRWGRIVRGEEVWSVAALGLSAYGAPFGFAQKGSTLYVVLGYISMSTEKLLRMGTCSFDVNTPLSAIPPIQAFSVPTTTARPYGMVASLVGSPDVAVATYPLTSSDGLGVFGVAVATSVTSSGDSYGFLTSEADPDTWEAVTSTYTAKVVGTNLVTTAATRAPYTPSLEGLAVYLPPGYTSYAVDGAPYGAVGWAAPAPAQAFWTNRINTLEAI